MKNIRFLTFVLIIGTLVLSACGAGTATPTAAPQPAKSAKVDAMPVSFVGIVDSIAGDQWVISGTTVTVDASVVRDGPFDVGDQVKVEGFVNSDGSFTISRVESPTPQESATLPAVSVDNSNEAISNANTNDANVNDSSSGVNSNDDNSNASNSNDSNINDDNGGNSNDDNSNSSNDNGDDKGGDRGNDNGDDNSGKDRGGDNDNGGNGRGGDDDSGGDDHGGGGGGSDD
jgi:uncharacterized membrane protein YgcG